MPLRQGCLAPLAKIWGFYYCFIDFPLRNTCSLLACRRRRLKRPTGNPRTRGYPPTREIDFLKKRFYVTILSRQVSFLEKNNFFQKKFNFYQFLMIFGHFWANFEKIRDLGWNRGVYWGIAPVFTRFEASISSDPKWLSPWWRYAKYSTFFKLFENLEKKGLWWVCTPKRYNSKLALRVKNQVLLKMGKTWFLTRKVNFELYHLGVHTHHKLFFSNFQKVWKI